MDTSWDAMDLRSRLLTREEYLTNLTILVRLDTLEVDIKAKVTAVEIFLYEIITITINNPTWM